MYYKNVNFQKKYHKMFYRDKFLMKNDQGIENKSPFAIAEKHVKST